MARNDALIRLHQRLVSRRNQLLDCIQDELSDLRHERGGGMGADDADLATDALSCEMNSQLAELEYRELTQIDRALSRMRDGHYGSCEVCAKKIPIARLNVLPYTPVCIGCQRQMERDPSIAEQLESNWNKVYENESSRREVTISMSDIETSA